MRAEHKNEDFGGTSTEQRETKKADMVAEVIIAVTAIIVIAVVVISNLF